MNKKYFAFILVLCFVLSGCSGTAPESSSTAKTETSLTENTSATEDIAPADYYIEGIEPKEIPSGFSMEVPHVDFGSMEEFKQALETQTFTPEQISSIQYFPSDAKGIRSVHPDDLVQPILSYGIHLKEINWYGTWYSFDLGGRVLEVLPKEEYLKAMETTKTRYSEKNSALSNIQQFVEIEEEISKTVTLYSTSVVDGKFVWYTVEDDNRILHVGELYRSQRADATTDNVTVYMEYDFGIYVRLFSLASRPALEWISYHGVEPFEMTDQVELQ